VTLIEAKGLPTSHTEPLLRGIALEQGVTSLRQKSTRDSQSVSESTDATQN